MGCSISKPTNNYVEERRKIDEDIEDMMMRFAIIGINGAGKSTLFKQISSIHGVRFGREDQDRIAAAVMHSIINGVCDLCEHRTMLTNKQEKAREYLIRAREETETFLTAKDIGAIRTLCNTNLIPNLYDTIESDNIVTNTLQYFLNKLVDYPEWGGEGWVPSFDDYLRVKIRTTGVVSHVLSRNGAKFSLKDVGGNRNSRKKWIHIFDDTVTLIFVAALSIYDNDVDEGFNLYNIQDDLALFSQTCNIAERESMRILLLFTKLDIFEIKYVKKKIPLNITGLFHDAPVDDFKLETGLEWIKSLYLDQIKDRDMKIESRYVSLLDKKSVEDAFDYCWNSKGL